MTPDTLAAAAMPPVPLSVEGASVLHQMMRFRRPAWRSLSPAARQEILHEASSALGALERPAEGRQSADQEMSNASVHFSSSPQVKRF